MEYITAGFKGQVIYWWWVHCWSDWGASYPEIIPSISYPTPWAKGVGTFESWRLDPEPHWGCVVCVKGPQLGETTCHPCQRRPLQSVFQQHHQPLPAQGRVPCFCDCPWHPRHVSPASRRKSPLLRARIGLFSKSTSLKIKGKTKYTGEN